MHDAIALFQLLLLAGVGYGGFRLIQGRVLPSSLPAALALSVGLAFVLLRLAASAWGIHSTAFPWLLSGFLGVLAVHPRRSSPGAVLQGVALGLGLLGCVLAFSGSVLPTTAALGAGGVLLWLSVPGPDAWSTDGDVETVS